MSRRRDLVVGAALGLLLFAVYVASPNSTVADSRRFVPAAVELVGQHSLDVAWTIGMPGGNIELGMYRDDRPDATTYPYYPLGPVVVAVPVVLVNQALHRLSLAPDARADILRHGPWRIERWVAGLVAAAVAVVVYAIALLVLAEVRHRRRWAAAVALSFGLATDAWGTASRALWQHGPSMLCLGGVVLLLLLARRDERWLRPLGVVVGFAYLMRPTNAIVVATVGLWVLVTHRRLLPWFIAGLAAVLVPLVVVNLHLYGSVLAPYYEPGAQGRNPRVAVALLGHLVSPARGIFVWAPVLLLAPLGLLLTLRHHRFTGLDAVVWATIGLHWLAISLAAPQWWGGYAMGPRLFSDVEPLLVYAALPAVAAAAGAVGRARLASLGAIAALVAAGFAVQLQAATLQSTWCWNVRPDIDSHSARIWSVRHGQFAAGYQRLLDGGSLRTELQRGGASASECVGV